MSDIEPTPPQNSAAPPPPPSSPPVVPQVPATVASTAVTPGHPFAETASLLERIHTQVRRVFLGQDEVVRQVLACLISGGHVLLEGKPGLGKTHLVVAMANTFGGTFGRIQFTPDLMPSDVTGHTLYDMHAQEFTVRKGPVFANLLLADEINRAPAKTQSALLEVMQEAQVTIDGQSFVLDPPFMAIATQNPIEQEGTYPLPEAQLDRFLMKVLIDYPSLENEHEIVSASASGASGRGLRPEEVDQVCGKEDLIRAQNDVASVKAVDEVVSYALNIARATRTAQGVGLGAGTRGAIGLVRIAKAYAVMDGRDFITPHDVKQAVLPVLRHRVALSPEMVISGQTIDHVLAQIGETVPPPRE
ncbi:MAG: MoxR family ATPase [Verrucomicrobiota bacterium]